MSRRVDIMKVLMRLAVAGVAVSAFACKKGEGAADTAQARPSVGAKTIVVALQAFTETLGSISNVVGRPNHTATLGAPTAARVGGARHRREDRAGGRVLIELDQTPFQAAIRGADAARSAERANERQRHGQRGIVPRRTPKSWPISPRTFDRGSAPNGRAVDSQSRQSLVS